MSDEIQVFPQDNPDQEKIKILSFEAVPYSDSRRVKITFCLSPFTNPPNASVTMTRKDQQIASVNIINIFKPENEITLHIPEKNSLSGSYQVNLDLFFIEEQQIEGSEEAGIRLTQFPIDSASIKFNLQ